MCNIFNTPQSFQFGGHLFRNGGCGGRLCSHTTGKVSTSHYSFGYVILCRKCNGEGSADRLDVALRNTQLVKFKEPLVTQKYMIQWEPVVS